MEYIKIKKVIEKLKNEKIEEVKKNYKKAKHLKSGGLAYGLLTANYDKICNTRQTLTQLQQSKPEQEQIQILFKKELKAINKQFEKKLKKIETIEQEQERPKKGDLLEIAINWHKSTTWGYNPIATIYYKYNKYYSGNISGCGYDKRSTATAEGLNQIKPLTALIMDKLEKEPLKNIYKYYLDVDARELLGYGLNIVDLPLFAGGVGFNCHSSILKNLGFKILSEHEGNYSDFYSFIKQ